MTILNALNHILMSANPMDWDMVKNISLQFFAAARILKGSRKTLKDVKAINSNLQILLTF